MTRAAVMAARTPSDRLARCLSALLLLVAATSCDSQQQPPDEIAVPDSSPAPFDPTLGFPNLLDHRGAPAGSEDWSFAPFADLGAWHGFGLPAEDRSELRGGFVGPFLMTGGRWTGVELVRATLEDAASGEAIDLATATDSQSIALPGLLRQALRLPGLEIQLQLWFESSRTTLIKLDIHNTGSGSRHLRVGWEGDLFADQGSLTLDEPAIVAQLSDGTQLILMADRKAVGRLSSPTHYQLALTEECTLPPGGGDSFSLAVSANLAVDDVLTRQPSRPTSESVEDSYAENRARWSRYLRALDSGRPPTDPVQILAVKSLQTLLNNWRAPAGRMRFSSLFPSSNVGYFNGFWAWDSWKHAVGIVRFDPELAKDQIRAMFDHQNDSGMIADVVYLDSQEDNWRDTKPPLAGWAIETVYQATGDLDFVRDLYSKLVAYHEFWYAERDHDRDGLCEYGSTDGTIIAARWESGMDNAVRFDNTTMLENGPQAWSMDQESVDLNSYLYREKRALAVLAEALQRAPEAARWTDEADRLRGQIQQAMFDEVKGWFYDIHYQTGDFIPVQGPEGWIPLWAGVATEAQATRLRESMLDPEKFRTHVPFPTVSRNHPEFSDGYWRGLVWLDQVYFAIEGLRRYGYHTDADALVTQLFSNLQGATVPGVPLRENYRALTGEGFNVNHFSWTAAHLLLLALSDQ